MKRQNIERIERLDIEIIGRKDMERNEKINIKLKESEYCIFQEV